MLLLRPLILSIFIPVPGVESIFNLTFTQSDYKIKFEWAELIRYDPIRVRNVQVAVFKFNRTCTASNITWEYIVDAGYNVEVTIQAYKFASNEFRLFPLRFQVNFCEAVSLNLIGLAEFSRCGNFSGCPMRRGVRYHMCNFVPDENNFPPFIPSGRYKLEASFVLHNTELWQANAYGEVYRLLPGQIYSG